MTARLAALATAAVALAAPLAAQAPRRLEVGRPVFGTLSSEDPVRRISRAPFQVWVLEGRRGQRVQLDLVSSDYDAYLIVRAPDGALAGRDDDGGDGLNSRLRMVLARDGEYRIIASALGDSAYGAYTLSAVEWTPPSGPAPGQAGVLLAGETRDGLLEPGDETAADGPYQDRWDFDVRQGARLRIELRSEDLDAYLLVLGPDGRELASDDDGLGDRDAVVTLRARAAGRYTALASSYGEDPSVGSYRIGLSEEIGAFAEPGVSASLASGAAGTGMLEDGDEQGPRGLTDRWTFPGRAGQVIRLDATAGDFDPYLVLLADGMPVDSNDDGGDGLNARLAMALPRNGVYTALVSAYTPARTGGRYAVSLVTSPPAPAPGRTGRIATGQRMAGLLEPGDETRADGGFIDFWEFDGRQDQDVTIELRSAAFDTYLELRDPRGSQLSENDDGLGEGTDSFIAARLPRSGRYRIAVRGYGDRESVGLYELVVGTVGAAARPGAPAEARLGETAMGRLEAGDSLMADGTYGDVFTFRPAASGRVTIQLRSGDFDAYLVLQDASGGTLATDDDGGTGTDSQLSYEVQAGRVYRIVATSYGEEASTGVYRLTVRTAN